jgi:uncharacterized phage infection (PIP) family protein YhgE
MELEIKEADLIKIKDGDLLVFKVNEKLSEQVYKVISRGLNDLKEEVKKNSGKSVSMILIEENMDIKIYRPVKKGGSKSV